MTTEAATLSVLVIEDEPQIRRFLRASLPRHGYKLLEATTAEEGLAQVAEKRPDLVLLDLGLPDEDGIALTHRLREWSAVPIIVITARWREEDKIAALDAGADDYLTKPFGVGELMARMRVALRHIARRAAEETTATFGEIRIDLLRRQVFLAEAEVHLSPIEYRLLTALARHAGKVMTQRQLLTEVWGPEYGGETHYVRVYMGHLRHKLERDPARPRHLITEPGVGYRLRLD